MNKLADKICSEAAVHATDTTDYIRRIAFIAALCAGVAWKNPNAMRIARSKRRIANLWRAYCG